MATGDLAQTYAQAVFDEAVQSWHETLKSVNVSLGKAGLTDQLDNASTQFSQKEELLRQVVPSNAKLEVQNFVKLLASKNHIHLLPQIIAEFDRRAQHGPQSHLALVTSAVELKADEKRALETKLRSKFGADTALEYKVDAQILGGIIVRVGDKVIDGSVAGKLATLKEKLKS
jgi:F-type H+-transporting ATPase subunit delta